MDTDAAAREPHLLAHWNLESDGESWATATSRLWPVRRGSSRLMLKVPRVDEERRGAALMAWWDGIGAAPVVDHDDEGVLLMARGCGVGWLGNEVRRGRDDDATRVLCDVAARLHAHRPHEAPPATPLHRWFAPLLDATPASVLLGRAASAARTLLAEPHNVVVLHGDLHHENVLQFEGHGWLAIDPKGLLGERTFEYANLLRNPDAGAATAPGRLAHQADVISRAAALERRRLLQWTLAFTGLSATWNLDDGTDPTFDLAVAREADAELRR